MKHNHYSRIILAIFFLVISIGIGLRNVLSIAHAVSSHVVVARVQTGGLGSGTANQELISLYNTANQDVDVSGWCVEYSAGTNGQSFSKLSCLQSGYENVGLWLPAGGWAHFGTVQFFEAKALGVDFYFSPGLAGGSGHVRVVDSSGVEIDRVGWGAAVKAEGSAAVPHNSGQVLSRDITRAALDTDNNYLDFSSVTLDGFVSGDVYEQEIVVDICPNIDGVQAVLPDGLMLHEATGVCEPLHEAENAPLQLSELYPDGPSYDTGQEFIELFNPTDRTVNLDGYVVSVGPSFTQRRTLSSGFITPGEYIAISDLQSGVTLPNTSGFVRLTAPDGTIVSEAEAYSAPYEEVSWALIDGVWQYTNQITPGLANVPYIEDQTNGSTATSGVDGVRVTSCPVGKVRNPATNRCRTVGATQTQMLACDAGEYRSIETNRCRKEVAVSGNLSPCKEGQVRNPATNRCKTASINTSELVPCKEGQVRNPDTNRCRKDTGSIGALSDAGLSDVSDVVVDSSSGSYVLFGVIVLLVAVGGYIIYEWRGELMRFVHTFMLKKTRIIAIPKQSDHF